MIKFDPKMTRYKIVQKWSKIDLPWGGLKLSKIDKFRPRGPGTLKTEFFEILHFFAKTPHFSTPKIDPKKGPYRKCHSPQKRLYFCSNGGVKNVTFWGVGGRTARTEKCRHYYIAIFEFRGSKVVPKNRFFTPTRSHTQNDGKWGQIIACQNRTKK
jgi:hypothetical protein